uniref:ATP synthase complex subunit 8 n=1 Tax=Cryptocephalus pominorum TaxID=1091374 RepID=A0A3G1GRR6_9CUCU|nr:ATP synthase F0 subunit 8 [Cryptocephalus pominorum]
MPQMAPLNWLTLFIVFSLYTIMFSSMNYFFFMKTPLKILTKSQMKIKDWSW